MATSVISSFPQRQGGGGAPTTLEVDRSFEGDMDDEEAAQVRLPTAQPELGAATQASLKKGSFAKRMRSYLQRKGPKEQSAWRPIRHHRVAAKRWCVNIDA